MKTRTINGKKYKLTPIKETVKETKYNTWYKKQGLKIIKRVQVSLPTGKGNKTYDGIKLSNGRIAVYKMNGAVLKYAWN